jgi:hypothetical protein
MLPGDTTAFLTDPDMLGNLGRILMVPGVGRCQLFKIRAKFNASHMRHPSVPVIGNSVCGAAEVFTFSFSFCESRACPRFRRDRIVPTAHSKREAASA